MNIHMHDEKAEALPLDRRPILFDGCEVCEERTNLAGILSLDEEHFHALWTRMLAVEYEDEGYRSGAEAKAGRELYYVSLLLQRHPRIMVTVP